MRILAVIAVLALAPITMASKNQPASAKNRGNGQQPLPPTPVSVNCNCNHQADNGKDKPQGWHKLITWPEGIVTWAVILTLGAIVWQAVETRRSVKAMRQQVAIAKDALIADHRPRLSIKHVYMIPPADITQVGESREWKIGCVVANVGESRAEVVESNVTIRSLGVGTIDGLLPAVPVYGNKYSFETFVAQPGERRWVEVPLDTNTDGMTFRNSYTIGKERNTYGHPRSDTTPIVCYGFLKYRDDSGVMRLSGFGYRWQRHDLTFKRMEGTEYNYED